MTLDSKWQSKLWKAMFPLEDEESKAGQYNIVFKSSNI